MSKGLREYDDYELDLDDLNEYNGYNDSSSENQSQDSVKQGMQPDEAVDLADYEVERGTAELAYQDDVLNYQDDTEAVDDQVETIDEDAEAVDIDDAVDVEDEAVDVDDDEDYGETVETDEDEGEDYSGQKLDPVLITLTDKKIPGLLNYMRGYGLNVQLVTDNPEQIAQTMMASYGKCEVLIIDTGTGLFATSESRKQIMNIVSQCDGDIRQFFFYTDNAIKTDIQDQLGRRNKKQVTWVKYKQTMLTVAEMLNHCHTYRNDDFDYQEDEIMQPEECLDKHVTLPTDYELDKQYSVYGFSPKIIREKVTETDSGLLTGYEPNFKVKMKL